MHYYELDENGFIFKTYLDDGFTVIPDTCINEPLPQPLLFIKPRWNGSQWEEGETQEEREIRESEELISSLTPSPEDIQESELEIKMITLLMELELI